MNIEKRKLSELRPAEYNPRVELQPGDPEFEKIARSIEEFGYVDPIIVNKDGTIIGGHQRCNVMISLGYEEADVVVVDMDKDHEKALNVALNKITGAWDESKLKDLLIDLSGSDLDINLTGFGQSDLDDLINKLTVPADATEDDFDVDSAFDDTHEAKTQLGDMYQLGRHRLMCGDSTDVTSVEKLMGDSQVDLFITDPPYNVDYTGKTKEALKIENDSMDNSEFREFLRSAFYAADSVMHPGASFYIWHADSEGYNFRGACVDIGWPVRQCLIWQKNVMVMGRQDYQWKHEPCLYGWKEGAAHLWNSDRKQTTLLEFDRPTRSELHPTMKPIPLFDYQIRNSSKAGDNVLDLFGGSGTTIMACEQDMRKAYVMELDPKYCDVIVRRWEEFTGKKAVLLNG